MGNKYAGWSLGDLKKAAAEIEVSNLQQQGQPFERGAAVLVDVQENLEAALGRLSAGWSGDAAQSAAGSAQAAIATVTQTQSTAASADDQIVEYTASVQQRQAAVAAIPDSGFHLKRALLAGAFVGPFGAGASAFGDYLEYQKNRAKAAELVSEMDSDGKTQAEAFKSQTWPRSYAQVDTPGKLPAPPHRPQNVQGGTSGTTGGTTRSQTTSFDRAGTDRPRGGTVEVATAQGGSRDTTDQPAGRTPATVTRPVAPLPTIGVADTTSASAAAPLPDGAVSPLPGALPPSGAGTSSGPSIGTELGLAGGAAAIAGGIGAGSLARQPASSLGAGRGSGGSLERGGAASPGRGGAAEASPGGRGSGLGAEARGGTPGRPSGAPGELVPRASGSGVASGGYPAAAGPGGKARDDEDELRARPEWLVEQDDIWGDGRLASPPVLG